jgi:hypothetical protein
MGGWMIHVIFADILSGDFPVRIYSDFCEIPHNSRIWYFRAVDPEESLSYCEFVQ